MQHSSAELSKYRLDRAKEDLVSARLNIENEMYKTAINRSYYAIFHAIRAVNVRDSFDASKHSTVIAHFNQYHVHKGDFPSEIYKVIKNAYTIREKCDYSDFFVVSKTEAETQLKNAQVFVDEVEKFLADQTENPER